MSEGPGLQKGQVYTGIDMHLIPSLEQNQSLIDKSLDGEIPVSKTHILLPTPMIYYGKGFKDHP
jgi:hypothetical protein